MAISHDTVRENVELWAAGALDADEARAIDAHVDTCADCAALARDAQETAAAMAMAVPMVAPPRALKDRIMTSAAVIDMPSRRTARWWSAAAAAAIVVGIGAVSWGAYMQTEMNDLHDRNASLAAAATEQSDQFEKLGDASEQNAALAESQDALLEIVSQPDVRRIAMEGTSAAAEASGQYVWSRDGRLGALVAKSLPPLAPDQVYCMWIVYENDWVYGAKFTTDDAGTGRVVIRDDEEPAADPGAFVGFAVTVEDASRAKGDPPGESVLRSTRS